MAPACHYLGRGKATLAMLLTHDAVNFGSGYFPASFARPEQSGFLTVAAGQRPAVRQSPLAPDADPLFLNPRPAERRFRAEGKT